VGADVIEAGDPAGFGQELVGALAGDGLGAVLVLPGEKQGRRWVHREVFGGPDGQVIF
jgi:hypothetical protein